MKTAEELIALYHEEGPVTWASRALEYLESQRWHPVSSYDEIPEGRWLVEYMNGFQGLLTLPLAHKMLPPMQLPRAYRALPEGYER